MKEPLLKDLMTPFPYSVDIEAPIGEARLLMLHHRVRHLPVTRGRKLVGLVTDRDVKLLLGPELGSPDPRTVTVEEAVVDDCYIVDIAQPLLSVLSHMAERHIGCAVVTARERLAGIFTTSDACRGFAAHLAAQFHPGEDDPPEAA